MPDFPAPARLALTAVASLASLLLGCAGTQLDPAWVTANRTVWRDPEAETLDPAVATAIDHLVAGKRIVFLGEPDHYIHEKYPYRLAILRRLSRHGFHHLGMEIGTSDGARIDRYLDSGDEQALARVALFGYAGKSPEERRELERFQPRVESDRAALRAFAAEERRFFRALRALRTPSAPDASNAPGAPNAPDTPGAPGAPGPTDVEEGGFRFFGYDTDAIAGSAYQDLRDTLAPVAGTPEATAAAARLALVRGEDLSQETLRVVTFSDEVSADPSPYVTAFGSERASTFQDQLHALSESLLFMVGRLQDPRPLAQRRFYERRETFMHRRLDRWLAAHPRDKLVLLGHNTHLSRASTTLSVGPSDGEHMPMWRSIGTHVTEPRPTEVLALWLLAPEGTHFMPDGKQPVVRDVPLRRNSLEAALAPFGDAFLLDLRRRPPGTPFDEVHDHGNPSSYGHGPVGRNADALVFFRRVSPPRE
ncbi:erythromycin esterase family protein [Chondromyces apiculatus]|uniref:Erythromycin esterase n=1 Tax=Chondromyces apiculatus DSM 436 TaxID=1192034 RepID=A0A017TCU5_9BACT|nr:erythromycin esterase family protein [Chondromyces apiculatus]EYF07093.1 Hypothetical protein CAP_1024 [Chondromyces apiculatus DSM 436]